MSEEELEKLFMSLSGTRAPLPTGRWGLGCFTAEPRLLYTLGGIDDSCCTVTVSDITVGQFRHGDSTVVVLDVCSPSEYAAGHVPGAVNVPLDEGDAVAGRYAGQDVVTVCHSVSRSLAAARLLAAAGPGVQAPAGGTEVWRRAGGPSGPAAESPESGREETEQ
jgi:rhodanese-related sulfurtransferase